MLFMVVGVRQRVSRQHNPVVNLLRGRVSLLHSQLLNPLANRVCSRLVNLRSVRHGVQRFNLRVSPVWFRRFNLRISLQLNRLSNQLLTPVLSRRVCRARSRLIVRRNNRRAVLLDNQRVFRVVSRLGDRLISHRYNQVVNHRAGRLSSLLRIREVFRLAHRLHCPVHNRLEDLPVSLLYSQQLNQRVIHHAVHRRDRLHRPRLNSSRRQKK